jgi:raffinose/stachyose/melibiose transport system permease protein
MNTNAMKTDNRRAARIRRTVPRIFGKAAARAIVGVLLVFALVVSLAPILYMISMSFMSATDYFRSSIVPTALDFGNYTKAWTVAHMALFYKNSIIVTALSVVLALAIASLAAYTVSRYRFPGRNVAYYSLLIAMMIPTQIIIIPLFINLRTFHLLNTYFALISPYTALGFAFAMFILRRFLDVIPFSLQESALIDGANKMTIYWSIMLPMLRPAIATAAIFLFLNNWNEFLLALTYMSDVRFKTLPAGVYSLLSVEYYEDYTTFAAALVMFTVPVMIVYFTLQKQFIRSLVASAIKG